MAKTVHIIMLVVSIVFLLFTVPATFAVKYFLVEPLGNMLMAVDIGLILIIVISLVKLKKG